MFDDTEGVHLEPLKNDDDAGTNGRDGVDAVDRDPTKSFNKAYDTYLMCNTVSQELYHCLVGSIPGTGSPNLHSAVFRYGMNGYRDVQPEVSIHNQFVSLTELIQNLLENPLMKEYSSLRSLHDAANAVYRLRKDLLNMESMDFGGRFPRNIREKSTLLSLNKYPPLGQLEDIRCYYVTVTCLGRVHGGEIVGWDVPEFTTGSGSIFIERFKQEMYEADVNLDLEDDGYVHRTIVCGPFMDEDIADDLSDFLEE